MITIALTEIEACISNALASEKKNILFISPTLEYDAVLEWSEKHPEYYLCEEEPAAYYGQKNGILVKNENYAVIPAESLEKANSKQAIWFRHAFSEKSILNFEGFLDIVKHRFYINRYPDGASTKYPLENMALFIAFTTPYKENDWAALREEHYALFDEIYVVK